VIVHQAATDNLTELLAGRASLAAFVWVLVAVGALAAAGGLLAVWVAAPMRWRRLLPGLLICVVLAALGLWLGLESAVVKYGQVFSALQFLLSAQRDAYVAGWALWLRLAGVLFTVVLCGAVMQYPAWRRRASNPPA
jgi:hypothetical protein